MQRNGPPAIRDTTEFGRVLNLGLGRAILHLQQRAAARYRETILHACLHCSVYDTQVEDRRDAYLFELIGLTGEREYYRDRILAALPELTDAKDVDQVLALIRRYAAQGDNAARERLYEAFASNVDTDRPHGADLLVDLDGLPALLLVADRLSLHEDEGWYARGLIDSAAELGRRTKVTAALAAAAHEHPRVAAFLELARRDRGRRRRYRRKQPTLTAAMDYSRLKRMMRARRRDVWSLFTQWWRQATEEELVEPAEDFLAMLQDRASWQRRPIRLYQILLARRRFPLDPSPLLALVRDPDADVARIAKAVLRHTDHPEVGALARELLAGGDGDAANMLVGNYRDGDYPAIERALHTWQDPWQVHSLGIALTRIVDAHLLLAAVPALLALYERTPCTLCRRHGVELLQRLEALPDWLAAECHYDASSDIRAAVRRGPGVIS